MEVIIMDDQKGLNTPMTQKTLEQVEIIRSGFNLGSRVSVTQLGRSTKWREALDQMTALEVVDRNQTAAVLLKPEAYTAMLNYIDQIEAELEQAQVEALFARREHMNQWASGEDLESKALTSLEARQDSIRGLLDGDK
jgi:hypothetical protein